MQRPLLVRRGDVVEVVDEPHLCANEDRVRNHDLVRLWLKQQTFIFSITAHIYCWCHIKCLYEECLAVVSCKPTLHLNLWLSCPLKTLLREVISHGAIDAIDMVGLFIQISTSGCSQVLIHTATTELRQCGMDNIGHISMRQHILYRIQVQVLSMF